LPRTANERALIEGDLVDVAGVLRREVCRGRTLSDGARGTFPLTILEISSIAISFIRDKKKITVCMHGVGIRDSAVIAEMSGNRRFTDGGGCEVRSQAGRSVNSYHEGNCSRACTVNDAGVT
jgi:hypothetical protein